jgi:hypothetical protein
MNFQINIEVEDGVSEPLNHALEAMQPARLTESVGPDLCELTRDYLVRNPGSKNGGSAGDFWAAAAAATSWKNTGNGSMTISIDQIGVRQRYRGGLIVPKNVRALTIPIHPDAYGKTARDFNNLIVIKTSKGAYLAQGNMEEVGRTSDGRVSHRNQNKRGKHRALTFLFKLSMGVGQEADPSVIPSPDEYSRTALAALDKVVTEIVREGR